MRERIQLISNCIVCSHMSDPAAARGQAVMAFGQTIGDQASVAGHIGAIAMLGAMLILAAYIVLLATNRRRLSVQPSGRTESKSIFDEYRARPVLFGCSAMVALVLAASAASAAPLDSPLGTWLTENGHGVIAITQCGDALCGRIVGIDRKPAEPMPTDVHGRSQCGLTIITNAKPESEDAWLGEITDPRDGGTYRAKLAVDEDGNLRLRGYIGIPLLGATQVWHKFTGHLTALCGFA
jgi:uncharacterized protein (DUF2147 family)